MLARERRAKGHFRATTAQRRTILRKSYWMRLGHRSFLPDQNALKHGNYTAAAQAALREKKRETRRILEIERRKFRELPEEWADRAFLAGLRQR
jgi:hypothetical protein